VCARVTPAHKARLVTAYRRLGHCVAMTGDIGIASEPAAPLRLVDPAALLAEGPDRSFGSALSDAIAVGAVATGLAGTAGYLAARLTGTSNGPVPSPS
jgi:hypothetical protein